MTMELTATPKEVMRAVETLQQFGREQNLSEKAIFGLALALEECGSNVVNHALNGDPAQKFRVTIERIGQKMQIELRDGGPEFDPTSSTRSSETAHEDAPPGGWGIQLVRRYIDEISYKREGAENILRLVKFIGESTSPTGTS